MMKKGLLLIGLTGVLFSSCIKHEVIPAPTPQVELYAHFIGDINMTNVEYTENVDGYSLYNTSAKIILPPPSSSEAVYFAEMASLQSSSSIKIGMGSVYWDSGLAAEPTTALFNDFFGAQANLTPNYSNDGAMGFEVTYTDQTGREWDSEENSVNALNVAFTGVQQESDATGDYSKFICSFDCYVYSLNPDSLALPVPVAHIDSLPIENAVFTGYFKR